MFRGDMSDAPLKLDISGQLCRNLLAARVVVRRGGSDSSEEQIRARSTGSRNTRVSGLFIQPR